MQNIAGVVLKPDPELLFLNQKLGAAFRHR